MSWIEWGIIVHCAMACLTNWVAIHGAQALGVKPPWSMWDYFKLGCAWPYIWYLAWKESKKGDSS